RSGGAKIKPPSASPSHQIHQSVGALLVDCTPPVVSDATPIVALIAGLTTIAQSSASTSRTRARRPSNAKRRSSHAPASASNVLPIATPAATASGSLEVALATD